MNSINFIHLPFPVTQITPILYTDAAHHLLRASFLEMDTFFFGRDEILIKYVNYTK